VKKDKTLLLAQLKKEKWCLSIGSNMDFRKLHQHRKAFLRENKEEDYLLIEGSRKVILSAPHGVSQLRLGKSKVAEPGSLATALYLQKVCDTYLIAKTKSNFDDANFDEVSAYKDEIDRLATMSKITHVIDFHGLASFREMDINLGTHLEQNTQTDPKLLDWLGKELEKEGFRVSYDSPFMGKGNAIAGYIKKRHPDLWTLQVEINCSITNKKENMDKYKLLLQVLERFINKIK